MTVVKTSKNTSSSFLFFSHSAIPIYNPVTKSSLHLVHLFSIFLTWLLAKLKLPTLIRVSVKKEHILYYGMQFHFIHIQGHKTEKARHSFPKHTFLFARWQQDGAKLKGRFRLTPTTVIRPNHQEWYLSDAYRA